MIKCIGEECRKKEKDTIKDCQKVLMDLYKKQKDEAAKK